MNTRHWQILWWFLFVVWVTCAILNMKHIPAGLLTSYGADITIPAWLYIATRSLDKPSRTTLLRKLFGQTPEVAALVIFVGSALTEVSQYYSPKGLFPGTFDYFDLLAYTTGIAVCYFLDKKQ